MKKECNVSGCPLNGKFDHNHQPRAFVESEAEGAHVVVLAPFESAEIDPKELADALADAVVSYDLHIEKIDLGGSIVKSAIRVMKARARLLRRVLEQLRAAPTIDQLHNAIQGVAEQAQRAYVEGERKITAPGCECASIMAADETRHFRGCPLREKYPMHEAEGVRDQRCLHVERLGDRLDPRQCIRSMGHAGPCCPSPEKEPLPINAWSSKEAAPSGAVAVEHKFEVSEPTVFDHDLEKHRKRVWARLKGGLEDFNFQLADAVFFLLAVAHQPLPVDMVPVDAVRERFAELEGRIEKLEPTVSDGFEHWADRVQILHERIDGLEAASIDCTSAHHGKTVRFNALEARIAQLEKARWPHGVPHAGPINPNIFDEMLKHSTFNTSTLRDRKIVCLCGSTRFSQAFNNANLAETLKGNIVLTVGSMMHSDDDMLVCVRCKGVVGATEGSCSGSRHQWQPLTAREHFDTKKALDALHFKKIEMADEVFVLNVAAQCPKCGYIYRDIPPDCCEGDDDHRHEQMPLRPYIGESTRNEIAHALRLGRGKKIRFLNPQGPMKVVDRTEYGQPTEDGVAFILTRELGL